MTKFDLLLKFESQFWLKRIINFFYWNFIFDRKNLNVQKKIKIIKNVPYKKRSNNLLTLDIYAPESENLKPGIVVVHGGAWSRRVGFMTNVSYCLAKSGFTVFNITYSLTPQPNAESATQDIADSVNWIYAHSDRYFINKDQLFGWGYSAGAHLLMYTNATFKLNLKGMVLGGTPAIFRLWPDSEFIENFLGVAFKDGQSIWEKYSLPSVIDKSCPPIFMYHAENDSLVSPLHMKQMIDLLTKMNIHCETYIIPNKDHVSGYLFSPTAVKKGIDFLNTQVQK